MRPERECLRERPHTIYKITCPDGRAYIGLTSADLGHRFAQHVAVANCQKNRILPVGCPGVSAAIRTFGAASLKVEALSVVPNRAAAEQEERRQILAHGTLHPDGMNVRLHKSDVERDWIIPRGERPWPPALAAS